MESKFEPLNIEKNKELFEYEMTEVILKLKGEFAVFSGNDTKFSEMATEDWNIDFSIPEIGLVDIDECNVEIPAVRNVQQTKVTLVEVKDTVLNLPTLPLFKGEDVKGDRLVSVKGMDHIQYRFGPKTLSTVCKSIIEDSRLEKPLAKGKNKNCIPIEVPKVNSIAKDVQHMKLLTHKNAISVCVPKMVSKCQYIEGNVLTLSPLENIQLKSSVKKIVDVPKFDINDINENVSSAVNFETVSVEIPTVLDLNLIELEKPNLFRNHGNDKKIPEIPTVSMKGVLGVEIENISIPVKNIPKPKAWNFMGRTSSSVIPKSSEYKSNMEKIKIPQIKINGNLDKVNVVSRRVISIPQSPKVEDTIDYIITLATTEG